MEENTLIDLADEYAQSIRNTDCQIAKLLDALAKAKKQRRNMLVSKLNSNLATLYRQRAELIEIETYLRRYYGIEEVAQAV